MPLHVRPPQSTPAHRRTLRELVRAGCENKPGTYRMVSSDGAIIYVGQSRRVRTRLLSYFRARGSRNKAARILRHAFHIEWEYAPTEFGALLRELRLIKQYRPHFNRQLVTDEWPRGYLAVVDGDVPGIRVVARSDYPDAVALYGPFRNVNRLREAVRALSEVTGVRDCVIDDVERGSAARVLWFASADASRTAGARRRVVRERAAGCLRHQLGTCAGPCIGQGDAAKYRQSVADAREFLEGAGDSVLTTLHGMMMRAADNLEFERAVSFRNRLGHLTWLHQRLHHFHANVDRLTFRYHAVGANGGEHVYLVRRGTVRAERSLPINPEEISAWDEQARRIFCGGDTCAGNAGGVHRARQTLPLHDLDEFHLVSSWFRRKPAERLRTRQPDAVGHA